MTAAYADCIYGLGGSALDPAGGMATLEQKIAALGVYTPPVPWDESNIQAVADHVKKHPTGSIVIIGGDSCGANKSPWVAQAVYPKKVDFMFCIQASEYCNEGCPPIPDNVAAALIFYSDAVLTGGLGTFKPPPKVGDDPSIYDGNEHLVNNGKTWVQYIHVPAPHPDDQDPVIQARILKVIQTILQNDAGQS
jgi:hypothetical protein